MAIKKILVPLSGDPETATGQEITLRVAFTAGRRHTARVEVLHVSSDPRDAVVFVGEGMTSTMIEGIITAAEKEGAERLSHARDMFDRISKELDIPIDGGAGMFSATFNVVTGREDEVVASRGRLADLIVVGQPKADEETRAPLTLEAALRETGRPVVLTPPTAKGEMAEFLTVAIAWNGSTEASRAVSFALPYLEAAQRVVIISVDEGRPSGPSASDLAEYLACHGIGAETVSLQNGDGRSAGKAILAEAAKVSANMLVMGAYTRSRMRRLIFGGVTSEVLEHTEVPVWMVH